MSKYSINAAKADLIKDSISYLTGSVGSAAITIVCISFVVSEMGLSGYGEGVTALAFYTAVFFVCNSEPWQSVIRFNSSLLDGVDFGVIKLSVMAEIVSAVFIFLIGYSAVTVLAQEGYFFLSEENKANLISVFCLSVLFMKGTAIGVLRVYRKVVDINLIIFTASLSRLIMLLLFFDGSADSLFVLWVAADLVHSTLLNIRAFWLVRRENPRAEDSVLSAIHLREFSAFTFKIWLIGRAKGAFANFGVLVMAQVTDPSSVALFSLYQRGLGFVTKFTGSFIRALYPIQKELKEKEQLEYVLFTRRGISRLDYIFGRTAVTTAVIFGGAYLTFPGIFLIEYVFIAVIGACTAQIFFWMSPYQTTLVTLDYETELTVFFCFHSVFSLLALYISALYFGAQGAVMAHLFVFLTIALWMRFMAMKGLRALST